MASQAVKIEPKKAVTSDPDERLSTGSIENQISALAYQLWLERGSPVGTDQEDWFRAENELKSRMTSDAAA